MSHVKTAALAESLLLVRASTMKMVRLQIAMERRDRALALQTMDEIVALDTRMSDFLDEMPIADAGLDAMRSEVEEQRSAVAREKFGLAAGVRKRDEPVGPRPWVDAPSPATADRIEGTGMLAAAPMEPLELTELVADAPASHGPGWVKILFATIMVLLLGGAIAAAFLLQPAYLTDYL